MADSGKRLSTAHAKFKARVRDLPEAATFSPSPASRTYTASHLSKRVTNSQQRARAKFLLTFDYLSHGRLENQHSRRSEGQLCVQTAAGIGDRAADQRWELDELNAGEEATDQLLPPPNSVSAKVNSARMRA